MYRLTTCGIALVLLLPAGRLAAQELQEKNFVRYTTQQGISHNIITYEKGHSIGIAGAVGTTL